MTDGDLTVSIPREIRDEIRNTREDLTGEIRHTNERLDRTNERLDRVVQEQIRHATAIVGLEASQREVVEVVKGLARTVEGLSGRLGV